MNRSSMIGLLRKGPRSFHFTRSYRYGTQSSSPWCRWRRLVVGTLAGAMALGLGYASFDVLPPFWISHLRLCVASCCDSPMPTSAEAHQEQSLLGDTLDHLKPIVVFVLGGPGVGKGTQCERLVREFGFVHLSAGDLLRAEQQRAQSVHAALISDCIKEGKIVPFHITISLLKREMSAYPAGTVFLIDGFPREMNQAWEFEIGVCKSTAVLVFECSEATMLERLMSRSATSGRSDDNIESIKKRFRTFTTASMPVIKSYEAFGMVRTVPCIGSPEAVFENTKQALADIIAMRPAKMGEKMQAHA